MKNKIIIFVAAIIIGLLSFYAGTKYSSGSKSSQFPNRGTGQALNLKSGANNFNKANFVSGKIIKIDEKSISVELPSGGSRIIFFSENSPINKTESGSASDLSVGKEISVLGSENSDGSISASSIQIK